MQMLKTCVGILAVSATKYEFDYGVDAWGEQRMLVAEAECVANGEFATNVIVTTAKGVGLFPYKKSTRGPIKQLFRCGKKDGKKHLEVVQDFVLSMRELSRTQFTKHRNFLKATSAEVWMNDKIQITIGAGEQWKLPVVENVWEEFAHLPESAFVFDFGKDAWNNRRLMLVSQHDCNKASVALSKDVTLRTHRGVELFARRLSNLGSVKELFKCGKEKNGQVYLVPTTDVLISNSMPDLSRAANKKQAIKAKKEQIYTNEKIQMTLTQEDKLYATAPADEEDESVSQIDEQEEEQIVSQSEISEADVESLWGRSDPVIATEEIIRDEPKEPKELDVPNAPLAIEDEVREDIDMTVSQTKVERSASLASIKLHVPGTVFQIGNVEYRLVVQLGQKVVNSLLDRFWAYKFILHVKEDDQEVVHQCFIRYRNLLTFHEQLEQLLKDGEQDFQLPSFPSKNWWANFSRKAELAKERFARFPVYFTEALTQYTGKKAELVKMAVMDIGNFAVKNMEEAQSARTSREVKLPSEAALEQL